MNVFPKRVIRVKKAILLSVILLLTSNLSFAANNDTFDPSQTAKEDVKRALSLLNYLDGVLSKPTPGFDPYQDVNFLDMIQSLKNFPDSLTFEIFKVTRLAADFYKKRLDTSVTDEGRRSILTNLSRLITNTQEYFARSKNELATHYIENLDIFVAKATEVKLSHKGYTDGSKPTAEEELRKAQEKAEEAKFIAQSKYLDFLVRLKTSTQGKKSEALKSLISESESLRRKFTNSNEDGKGQALGNMKYFNEHALRFSTENRLEFGIAYFRNQSKQIELEIAQWNADFIRHNQESLLLSQEIQRKNAENTELTHFLKQLNGYIWGTNAKDLHRDWVTDFKDTKIKFSYLNTDLAKTSGNVVGMATLDSWKKTFTIEVLTPSVHTKDVLRIATEALLKHSGVYGVYLENSLKIPSDLNKSEYEVNSLGRGRVLLKLRPLTCSNLFL